MLRIIAVIVVTILSSQVSFANDTKKSNTSQEDASHNCQSILSTIHISEEVAQALNDPQVELAMNKAITFAEQSSQISYEVIRIHLLQTMWAENLLQELDHVEYRGHIARERGAFLLFDIFSSVRNESQIIGVQIKNK